MGRREVKCPQCGSGNIVLEFLQQVGHVHRILKDGAIGKRPKLVEYDGEGEMLYCKDCGYNFDENHFQLESGKIVLLKDLSEEGNEPNDFREGKHE